MMVKLNLLLILGLVAREVTCAYYHRKYSSSGRGAARYRHFSPQASSRTRTSQSYHYWFHYPRHYVHGYPARSARGHRRHKKHSRPRYNKAGSRASVPRARKKGHRKPNRIGGRPINRYRRKKRRPMRKRPFKRHPRVTGGKKPTRKPRGGAGESQALLYAVNQERRKRDLSDLRMNAKLDAVAQKQSNYQNMNNIVTHSDGNGLNPSMRCKRQGYGMCAENVALGQKSVAEVMDSWMHSQGHRDNILNPKYKEFGAARIGDAWTQNFGFGNERPKNRGYYY